jgi:hypothetical protein
VEAARLDLVDFLPLLTARRVGEGAHLTPRPLAEVEQPVNVVGRQVFVLLDDLALLSQHLAAHPAGVEHLGPEGMEDERADTLVNFAGQRRP